ncbi:hypothetical protein AOL_s00079g111 [Orbilia oligospora ATCC 24927]|uniref:SET domain-containing protein n=1 Tax=Arthrobotrys oligospora (strain ATCC 24927 / CBS 115.81 / DSM 1491) TaxID=756982 RepID=G1XD08_ARTOA|nr:hypothetical protein AOL_s00079g111 [Orbilia oligospora ATCC 24927]EGX48890.1 hypothetical protein AOL_s00079g111 [Orbilia oligospora ATCC 24927]
MPKRRRPSSSSQCQDFLADGVPESHQRLLEHVLANNARLSKVKIARLPHGTGIVASERVKKNEEITFIPKSLLVNLHDIPFPNSSPIDHPTKVHSSLAAYIASQFHKSDNNDPFISILPSFSSFKSSMPLFWSNEVLDNCSPWVRSFAIKQQEKLKDDYAHALKMHGERGVEFSKEEYEWAWAAVNTRTIYYRPKKWYKVPAEDCMTMCPFIDYYNHDAKGDESCTVSFSIDGLRVTTQKEYSVGEEIFVTYGEYNNDHLLVEYGFTLPKNQADNMNIDHWVLPKLSSRHQEILKEISFHGYAFTFSQTVMYSGSDLMISVDGDSEYLLDENEVCYRTMMALRLAVIKESMLGKGKRYKDFMKLVEGGMEEDDYVKLYEKDEKKVGELLEEVLKAVEEFGEEKTANLRRMLEREEFLDQKESIKSAIGRWRQCIDIIAKHRAKNN